MAVDAVTNLYTTLRDKVKAIQVDSKNIVSLFTFWNQNDLDSAFQARSRDVAVFFSIDGEIPWNTSNDPATLALNEENATCSFSLRIARKSLKVDEEATLELLALRNCIHRNIIGIVGENFGFIKRVGESQDVTHNNVIYWQMRYTCKLQELPTDANRSGIEGTSLNLSSSFQVE